MSFIRLERSDIQMSNEDTGITKFFGLKNNVRFEPCLVTVDEAYAARCFKSELAFGLYALGPAINQPDSISQGYPVFGNGVEVYQRDLRRRP